MVLNKYAYFVILIHADNGLLKNNHFIICNCSLHSVSLAIPVFMSSLPYIVLKWATNEFFIIFFAAIFHATINLLTYIPHSYAHNITIYDLDFSLSLSTGVYSRLKQ